MIGSASGSGLGDRSLALVRSRSRSRSLCRSSRPLSRSRRWCRSERSRARSSCPSPRSRSRRRRSRSACLCCLTLSLLSCASAPAESDLDLLRRSPLPSSALLAALRVRDSLFRGRSRLDDSPRALRWRCARGASESLIVSNRKRRDDRELAMTRQGAGRDSPENTHRPLMNDRFEKRNKTKETTLGPVLRGARRRHDPS